jgi:hypothetical protein
MRNGSTASQRRPIARSGGSGELPRQAQRRSHSPLAGEGIDDPGAQFGTDSSIADVFFTRCSALPANTISTRSSFIAHLAKSLHSTDPAIRLPHPLPSTDGLIVLWANLVRPTR